MARSKNPTTDPAALEHLLGHTFQNPALLEQALTHRSFARESAPESAREPGTRATDNEKLEFLGDAILGMLAAEGLWHRFPQSSEGELTRFRSAVVSRKYLGTAGQRLGLGVWLRLGQSVEDNNGRASAGLVSNALEAIIAAIYLDAGLPAARAFVEREVLAPATFTPDDHTVQLAARAAHRDHKTALQELLQARSQGRPDYRLSGESGPAHQRTFRIAVHLPGHPDALAIGEGSSKKQAEQEAARLALEALAGAGQPHA